MRVLILGATGRIGNLVLQRFVADGHEVVAVVRDPAKLPESSGVVAVAGDAEDATVIREAVSGADAVVATLGPRENRIEEALALEAAMRVLVASMEDAGVRRLVALSGAGISVPGDQKPVIDRLASSVVGRLARHVVGAKQREFDVFSQSSLDWTAVRPPLVRDGPAVGYRLSPRLEPGARVTRADTAAAIADQLVDRAYFRAAPFVLPPKD